MALVVNKENILVGVNDYLKIFNKKTLMYEDCIVPKLEKNAEEKPKQSQTDSRDITALCYSECGNYSAVCLQNKQLVIYDSSFKVVHNTLLNRVASRIRFTKKCNLLVADKTGDAYLYKMQENQFSEPVLLLGHLSMLLDITLSDCEKYVITCDRDEKIRVSCFPNAYNIVSYCLGHKQFITNIDFINKNCLVSASGDGTIRFWNYLQGEQIGIVNTNNYLTDKSLIKTFCDEMDESVVGISELPITFMSIDRENSLVAVSLHKSNEIQIHAVKQNELIVESSLLQLVAFENKLLSLCFTFTKKLYLLTNCSILLFEYDSDKFVSAAMSELSDFYNHNKIVLKANALDDGIPVLFKRKFDNVQEYLERKKLRLEQNK